MKKILIPFAVLTILYLSYLGVKLVINSSIEDQETATNFSATLIDGTQFELLDLKGNYVLLDFWGSWCATCRKANPKLVALQNSYPEKLTVVTIALEKNKEAAEKAAIEDGFTWKHQIVEEHQFVMLSSIARQYGVTEIPSKFLITPKGTLLKELSFAQMDSVLQQ